MTFGHFKIDMEIAKEMGRRHSLKGTCELGTPLLGPLSTEVTSRDCDTALGGSGRGEGTLLKEGRLLRNISPSLGLCDHFPGSGILNYRPDRDWSLRVCYFGDTFENTCYWYHEYTYYSPNGQT